MMTLSVKNNKNPFFNEFLNIIIYSIFDCALIPVALARQFVYFLKYNFNSFPKQPQGEVFLEYSCS